MSTSSISSAKSQEISCGGKAILCTTTAFCMFCQLSRLNFLLRRVFTCEQLDQRASHGAAAPRLYLKAEHEQKIGAFKIRGAINAICSLALCIQIRCCSLWPVDVIFWRKMILVSKLGHGLSWSCSCVLHFAVLQRGLSEADPCQKLWS